VQKEKFLESALIGISTCKARREGRSHVRAFSLIDFSAKRIEQRGSIAKDVTLDVQVFKHKIQMSLLDEITKNKNGKSVMPKDLAEQFQQTSHPIIIVPQSLSAGSLCLGNIQQFLEKG
jgi:hypothetical protein